MFSFQEQKKIQQLAITVKGRDISLIITTPAI